MPRLENQLVYDLIEVAERLAADQVGRASLMKASRRRAVSTAYYAVFHGLAYLCSDALVGWSQDEEELRPAYRALDHSIALKRLASGSVAAIDPSLAQVGTILRELRDQRISADYELPSFTLSAVETIALIAQARDVIGLLETLSDRSRLRLAVRLILSRSDRQFQSHTTSTP